LRDKEEKMIIRNLENEIVKNRWYIAHGGGLATQYFSSNEMAGLLFFAYAEVKPGKAIEQHIDPYEEIYYILEGTGVMKIGEDEQLVEKGDTIWLPHNVPHSLFNNGLTDCVFLATAAMPRSE
jgi:mannose-6-phosphate isomerase-like protein (cupin superfamily)